MVRLLLLEKGTDPVRPDMGVGIVSRYRYMFEEECPALENDIRQQIQTYLLPYSNIQTIKAEVIDKELHLTIKIDDATYSYKTVHISEDSMTLEEVINSNNE